MANTTKEFSEYDGQQTLQASLNDADKTFGVSGFISNKVGNTITRTIVSSTVEDYRFFDTIAMLSGTIASGFPQITGINTTSGLVPGQYVLNPNFPQNTTILSVDSQSQVTLSANATGTGTFTFAFANLLYLLEITYDDSTHDNVNMVQRLA
jgi:hypothetical protein